MKTRLYGLLLILLFCTAGARAQNGNTGIGTSNAGSYLTVSGSIGVGCLATAVTSYAILDNDYYIVWTGSANGTATLPAAAGSKKGRMYKLKNNTAAFKLTISPTSGVLIDGAPTVVVQPANSIEIIANGNTSGTCWEVVGHGPSIADNLSTAGASSGTLSGSGGACTGATVTGSFVQNMAATTQYATVNVVVTRPGTYTIATNTVNGLIFEARGYFTAAGTQAVQLFARGKPTAGGTYAYTFAYGSSHCSFSIAVISFTCGSATLTQSPNGPIYPGGTYTGSYTIPYTSGDGTVYSATSQTINGLTLTRTAGTYAAGGGNVSYTLTGTSTAVASATFAIPECSGTVTFGDGIRQQLAAAGCLSCAAYDAAMPDTWVQINSSEFATIRYMLPGISLYGSPDALMTLSPSNSMPNGKTFTQDIGYQTKVSASNYPVAMSIRTGIYQPTSMLGIKLKLSTSATGGYTNFPFTGATTPDVSGGPAANTTYYFVIKRPNSISSAIGASYIAFYTPIFSQIGADYPNGTGYIGNGDISTPSSASYFVPYFQVLGTATRSW